MKTLRNLALIALLLAPVCVPLEAYAASVDLNLTALFGSGPGTWPWCSGNSCVKTTYTAVHNFGGANTMVHLYAATFDDSTCPMSIEHMYAVNCDTGAVSFELAHSDVSGVNDWTGTPTVIARKAQQRPLNVNKTICYRVDFGFSTPPGHAGYEGCDYELFVKPGSTDVDSDHGEYGSPLVNHGETLTWEML